MTDFRQRLPMWPFAFAMVLAVALLIANVIALPSFVKPAHLPEELAVFAPFGLAAIASTPSILSGGGGIDISIGPLIIIVNVVLVVWLLPHHVLGSAWIAIPIALAIGAGVGAVNGLLVAVLRYKPVIATLCTFFVMSGLVLKIAPNPESVGHDWTTSLGDKVGPIPGAVILLAIPAVIWLTLSRTSYHRTLYAVGGDDATAYSAGVNVVRARLIAYTLGGLIAAVGGIALTALVQSTATGSVTDYTLVALASVALGGTSFGGGRGGMLGSAFGALSIYLLQTLLESLHISPNWLQLVYGGLLVVGVIVGAALFTPRFDRGRATA